MTHDQTAKPASEISRIELIAAVAKGLGGFIWEVKRPLLIGVAGSALAATLIDYTIATLDVGAVGGVAIGLLILLVWIPIGVGLILYELGQV